MTFLEGITNSANSSTLVMPKAFLVDSAANQIPIILFSSETNVGQIATARISIPPEYYARIPDMATNNLYTVQINSEGHSKQKTIFTGYISGKYQYRMHGSLRHGIDLQHPARDLDQMRIVSPGMHAGSCSDTRYLPQTSTAPSVQVGSRKFVYFDGTTTNLAQQIINGIIARLNNLESNVIQDPAFGFKSESFAPAIALLKKIRVLNGTLSPKICSSLCQANSNPINIMLNDMVDNSFSSQSSLWDLLTMIFSNFGFVMFCHQEGQVQVTADLSGIRPPTKTTYLGLGSPTPTGASNTIGGSNIISFQSSSAFQRNVASVVLISDFVQPAASRSAPNSKFTGSVVSYPLNPKPDDAGATMSITFPSWLKNIAYSDNISYQHFEPPTPGGSASSQKVQRSVPNTDPQRQKVKDVQMLYAQMIYNLERNKYRTITVTTPLAPTACPGTTAYIQPMQNVTPLSMNNVSARDLNNDIQTVYSGYCCSVQHMINVDDKEIHTTLTFRNSSTDMTAPLVTHPLYTDATAFPWD